MFLRRYSRTKNGKTYTYFALVESVRTAAGPRQRVVANLGELSADQELRWQRTTTFYNRHGDAQQLQLFPDDDAVAPEDPNVVRVRLGSVGWTNARRFGDVAAAHWLWKMLGLDVIVDRHVPQGKETARPADIVAIEVINRLCAPCSEFALAEHWYRTCALDDLLGVPDEVVTKDRLYRTLDDLLAAKTSIEDDLKSNFGTLFELDYNLLLYDLTSSYFEGLAEGNAKAKRGYSRDHRGDCKQIILALVVTPEGFPLAHCTMEGNTQDVTTVGQVVGDIEKRFGKSQRVWVMDRGMISDKNLAFFNEEGRRYVLATRRSALTKFMTELRDASHWQRLPDNPEVRVKLIERDSVYYLLARSKERQHKERAIRRGQRRQLKVGLRKLAERVEKGRLKNRDKIVEAVGRLKSKFPKAQGFYAVAVAQDGTVTIVCHTTMFRDALTRDGAYLLQSNREGWTAQEFWQTYIQLTVVEKAFRVLKSELLIRPIWHHYSHRVEAHVFVCVLAYALWKTLDHLLKRAGLQTLIRKPDEERSPEDTPQARPMSPEVCLRELRQIMVGDILLETTDGRRLALRRVARPNPEQERILTALGLELPERLSNDRQL